MWNVGNNRGMTLVEVSIASAIGAVVMLGLMAAQGQLGRAVKGVTHKSNVISDHSNIISVLSNAQTCADALRSGSGSNARGMVLADRGAVYTDGVDRIVLPNTTTVIAQRGVVREGLRLESIQMITSNAGFQYVSGNNWEADVRMVLRWAEANVGELRALGNQSFERMLALRVTINSPAPPAAPPTHKKFIERCSFTTSSSGSLANEEQMCQVMGGTYDENAVGSRCILTKSGLAVNAQQRALGISELTTESGLSVAGMIRAQNRSITGVLDSSIIAAQDSAGPGHALLEASRTGDGNGNAELNITKDGTGSSSGNAFFRLTRSGTSGHSIGYIHRTGNSNGTAALQVLKSGASNGNASISAVVNAGVVGRPIVESISEDLAPVIQSLSSSSDNFKAPIIRFARQTGTFASANPIPANTAFDLGWLEAMAQVPSAPPITQRVFGRLGFTSRPDLGGDVSSSNNPASFQIQLARAGEINATKAFEILPNHDVVLSNGLRVASGIRAQGHIEVVGASGTLARMDATTIGTPSPNAVPVSADNQGQMRWKELVSFTLDRPLFHSTTTSCRSSQLPAPGSYNAGVDVLGGALAMGCNSPDGICVELNSRALASAQMSQIVSCSVSRVRNDMGHDGHGRGGSLCEAVAVPVGGTLQWQARAKSWNGATGTALPGLPGGPEGTCVECNVTCIGWKN